MIKKLLILSMSLACLMACETKEASTSQEPEMVQMTFNVSALNVSVEPMERSTTRATAASTLTKIYYYLKNTETNSIYSGVQTLVDNADEFGELKLWLPSGTYTTRFFGAGVIGVDGFASMMVDEDYNTTFVSLDNADCFYLSEDITITNESTQMNMNLPRLSSSLVIRLNDELPKDIKDVKIKLSHYSRFDATDWRPVPSNSYGSIAKLESSLTIQDNMVNEFSFYLLPQTERTLIFTIFDNNNEELGTCSVKVSFYQNRKTIVEGNLLDIINQKPFSVTVSTEWDDDYIVPLE